MQSVFNGCGSLLKNIPAAFPGVRLRTILNPMNHQLSGGQDQADPKDGSAPSPQGPWRPGRI